MSYNAKKNQDATRKALVNSIGRNVDLLQKQMESISDKIDENKRKR